MRKEVKPAIISVLTLCFDGSKPKSFCSTMMIRYECEYWSYQKREHFAPFFLFWMVTVTNSASVSWLVHSLGLRLS